MSVSSAARRLLRATPHAPSGRSASLSDVPSSVSEYSTRGGTSRYTSRWTSPSSSISRRCGGAEQLARQLEAGEYPGDLSTTLMMGATAEHILRTSEQAGIDVELPATVRSHYDRAVAAGHGTQDWAALYEVIKAPD